MHFKGCSIDSTRMLVVSKSHFTFTQKEIYIFSEDLFVFGCFFFHGKFQGQDVYKIPWTHSLQVIGKSDCLMLTISTSAE